jgi:hypothetical protein
MTEVIDERSSQRIARPPSDDRHAKADCGRLDRRVERGRFDVQTPHAEEPRAGRRPARDDKWRFIANSGGTNVRPKRRTGDRRRDGVEATGERPPDRRFDKHADPPNDGVDEAPRTAEARLPADGIEVLGSGDTRKRIGLSRHDQQRAAGGAVPTLEGDRSGAKLHQGGFGGHGELLGPAANQRGRREDLFRIEGSADSRICSGDVSPNRTLPGSEERGGISAAATAEATRRSPWRWLPMA